MRKLEFFYWVFLWALWAGLSACAGTRSAYNAAETIEQQAFVVTEHYAALVSEAADLRDSGALAGDALLAVQAAEGAARPLILQLRDLVQAYTSVRTAENLQELQEGLGIAVVAVSDFINTIQSVRQ